MAVAAQHVERGVTVVVADFSGRSYTELQYELLDIVEVAVSAGKEELFLFIRGGSHLFIGN
jgi:hypothetical protein